MLKLSFPPSRIGEIVSLKQCRVYSPQMNKIKDLQQLCRLSHLFSVKLDYFMTSFINKGAFSYFTLTQRLTSGHQDDGATQITCLPSRAALSCRAKQLLPA